MAIFQDRFEISTRNRLSQLHFVLMRTFMFIHMTPDISNLDIQIEAKTGKGQDPQCVCISNFNLNLAKQIDS